MESPLTDYSLSHSPNTEISAPVLEHWAGTRPYLCEGTKPCVLQDRPPQHRSQEWNAEDGSWTELPMKETEHRILVLFLVYFQNRLYFLTTNTSQVSQSNLKSVQKWIPGVSSTLKSSKKVLLLLAEICRHTKTPTYSSAVLSVSLKLISRKTSTLPGGWA